MDCQAKLGDRALCHESVLAEAYVGQELLDRPSVKHVRAWAGLDTDSLICRDLSKSPTTVQILVAGTKGAGDDPAPAKASGQFGILALKSHVAALPEIAARVLRVSNTRSIQSLPKRPLLVGNSGKFESLHG